MSRRLLVFTKAPTPGRVKTRLVPPLTAEQAARVHAAAMLDTVGRAMDAAGEDVEVWTSGDARAAEEVAALVGRAARLQSDGDLGARLADAFARSFDEGAERVVIVGSDHPTLPSQRLSAAFERLGAPAVVLGPSRDGGYYAVGLRRDGWPAARALFEEIPWSSARVLDATRRAASAIGLEVRLLEEWYDVDEVEDLARALRDAEPSSKLARLFREPELRARVPAARRERS